MKICTHRWTNYHQGAKCGYCEDLHGYSHVTSMIEGYSNVNYSVRNIKCLSSIIYLVLKCLLLTLWTNNVY